MGLIRGPVILVDSVVSRLEVGILMVEAILRGPFSQLSRLLMVHQVVVVLSRNILTSSSSVHHQHLFVHHHFIILSSRGLVILAAM